LPAHRFRDEGFLGGRDIKLEAPQSPDAPVLHIRSSSVIGGVRVRESRRNKRRSERDDRGGRFRRRVCAAGAGPDTCRIAPQPRARRHLTDP
jgi:hypothetical protein